MDEKDIHLDLRHSSNDFNDASCLLNLLNANIKNIILILNPFKKEITTNNSQLIYLKLFPNLKYYNHIKKFNGILILSYLLFTTYFTINFIITKKYNPDLFFIEITSILIIYCFIYNILFLKLIIYKDFINFKNKALYFNKIRKIDFDKEYKFIEIYIKGEFRKNKLDCIYPDMTIYFDNKYRTKAVEDYWENYKSKSMETEVFKKELNRLL